MSVFSEATNIALILWRNKREIARSVITILLPSMRVALLKAVYFGDIEQASFLLELGIKPSFNHFRAVKLAAMRGNVPMVNLLVASLSSGEREEASMLILYYSCIPGRRGPLSTLLRSSLGKSRATEIGFQYVWTKGYNDTADVYTDTLPEIAQVIGEPECVQRKKPLLLTF